MAYMSQEQKKIIAAKLKDVVPKGWKYSLRVCNHSTLYLTIRSAPVDILADLRDKKNIYGDPMMYNEHTEVNRHGLSSYNCPWSDKYREIFQKIYDVMNDGNHDNSDIMTDFFDVGYYAYIQIGTWDKPFKVA